MFSLLQRIGALESLLTKVESTPHSSPYSEVHLRSIIHLQRLILPGTVLRFPTKDAWEEFRERFSIEQDVYDLIQHVDPLGFSGDNPRYYDEESNPLNYLKRVQLPPLRIEMSSVYNPSIKGEFSRPLDTNLNESEPFLGSLNLNGTEFPTVKFPLREGSKSYQPGEVLSSLTPKIWNCSEALAFGRGFYAAGRSVSIVINFCQQIFGSPYDPLRAHVIASPNVSTPIPQDEDLSRPTVGCFWFNHKKQIPLPKDPLCRTCIIVRFKKYLLL